MRFAAGSLEGPRGGIWTLWTGPDGDVYIGGSGLTRDLKLSLHRSGDRRHAFSREHYRRQSPIGPPKKRRIIKRWQRPSEFARGGFTRAFQLIVPHVAKRPSAPALLLIVPSGRLWQASGLTPGCRASANP
jgi:hypothetical protein